MLARNALRLIVLVTALSTLAATARADAPLSAAPRSQPGAAEAPPPAREERYVGTMAAASAIGLGVTAAGLVAAVKLENRVVLGLAATTYLCTGSAVHAIRGRSAARAVGSVVLHAGLPFLGLYMAGEYIHDDDTAVITGVLAGVATAAALDMVFAVVPVRAAKTRALAPVVSARADGMSLGLAGTF